MLVIVGTAFLGIGRLFGESVPRGDFFEPIPAIPADPGTQDSMNTVKKIELGNFLFFEPAAFPPSGGYISCANLSTTRRWGYTDSRIPRATGHDGQVGERNTPTVLRGIPSFFGAQFWDGRADTLEEQALGPIGGRRSRWPADRRTRCSGWGRIPRMYREMFDAAFPERLKTRSANENMALALAAFQRTLTTPRSPLDMWLAGGRGCHE